MAGRKPASIRTLWGLAKSPELQLGGDDLHLIVQRETGKASMKELTQRELDTVARVLCGMKDSAHRGTPIKRTDAGGNPRTVKQRQKIYRLCETLGWNGDNKRVNGFCKRMFRVDRIEWLTPAQCGILTEALKKMIERKEACVGRQEDNGGNAGQSGAAGAK